MKIKREDTVLVISGKYRGKIGKVLKVYPKKEKVLVEGVNMVKKHQKPRKSGEKGSIIQMPSPIHVSNLKLICQKCKKATRIGYKMEKGEKKRICKKCGQPT